MARQTGSSKTSQAKRPQKGTGRANAKASGKGARSKARGHASGEASEARIIDDRTRRDLIGVVFAVLAVVVMVAAVMPTNAIVTSFVSTVLHLSLGLGAYLLPFFLLAVGVSFLVRFERERVPARVTIGLLVVFVALLSLLSLFTPLASPDDLSPLFAEQNLVVRGGYLGAGIAWVGLALFGQIVSCVVMIGLVLAGLAIIGFSVSQLIERARAAKAAREDASGSFDAPPFARVRQGRGGNASGDEALSSPVKPAHPLSAAPTQALSRPGERRRPRRASMPLQDASESQFSAAVTAMLDPLEGEAAPLTRKLGRKHAGELSGKAKERAASGASFSQASSPSSSAPLATPHPQEGFELPPTSMLAHSDSKAKASATDAELGETAARLQETLESFSIYAEVVGWVAGPTVTLFKVDLPAGVRVSRVTALEDDIALALAAPGVRIFAPIPGTNYVGIEVPNRTRESVLLGDVLKDASGGPLMIAIGKDVEGHSIVSDLAKMPHLLIGGTTGSGKSVSINAMIMSILMRATPAEVRFIMVDPKRVEFTPYNGIPHLYVPVVTEAKEAASALSWGVAEMERRLKVFSKVGARNIGQFNAKAQAEQKAIRKAEEAGEEPPASELGGELPYIVIIIDELADLMMNVGKEVEFSISRIAQLARAAGIHLIVATQRPSTNVVTGLIKANITNRIAFNVASGIDSRVILDTPGAENLIGLGDLLLSKPEFAKPQRIQGCYVSEDEINAVVEMLKEQGEPEYHSEILQTNLVTLGASSPDGAGGGSQADDPLIWEAADIVVSSGLGSTSNIQRRLKVGYSRAGRIMDMLEEKGVVGPPNGSKPREVLVDAMELETLKAFEANDAKEGSSLTGE